MRFWFVVIMLFSSLILIAERGFSEICKSIEIEYTEGQARIAFTSLELSLICEEKGGKDWKYIPRKQRQGFLEKFLSVRGYYAPVFRQTRDRLTVITGPQSRVDRIELHGDILDLDPKSFWKVYDAVLNSGTLDAIEQWTKEQYAVAGYPCIQLDTKAYPEKNLVTIMILQANLKRFGQTNETNSKSNGDKVKRRFDAYQEGEEFNSNRLRLTEARLKQEEYVFDTILSPKCKASEIVNIEQRTTVNKPRLLSLGIGFDSDEYLFFEGSWGHANLFSSASNIKSKIFASHKRQQLLTNFNWYYAPITTRHHLRTSLSFEHSNSRVYDVNNLSLSSGPVVDFDKFSHRFFLWVSPSLEQNRIFKGEGPNISNTFLLKSQFSIESEKYELLRDDPSEGYSLSLKLSSSQKGMGALYSSNKYELTLKSFHNILNLNPAIWVLGLRAGLLGFDFDSDAKDKIPGNMYPRLGGASTIRGHALESLPKEGLAIAYFGGIETRIRHIIPYGISPYLFIDVASARNAKDPSEKEKYTSPGLGLHWNSPIGVLRFYASYPLSQSGESHGLKLNFNLGDQF